MGKKIGAVVALMIVMCLGIVVFINTSFIKGTINSLTGSAISDTLGTYKLLVDTKIEQQIFRAERLAEDRMIEALLGGNNNPPGAPPVEGKELLNIESEKYKDGYLRGMQQLVNNTLKTETELEDIIDTINVMDSNGVILSSSHSELVENSVAEEEYFIKTMETGKEFIGESMISDTTGEVVVPISAPILGPDHQIKGVISVMIATRFIAEEIQTSTILNTEETYAILFDGHGMILGHKKEELIGKPHEDENLVKAIENHVYEEHEEDENEESHDEHEEYIETVSYYSMASQDQRQLHFINLDEADWVIAITTNPEEFLKPLNRLVRCGIIVSVIVLTISVMLLVLLISVLFKGLDKITKIIEQMASLNLRDIEFIPGMLDSKDEIGIMARATSSTKDKLSEIVGMLIRYADDLGGSADKMSKLSLEIVEDTSRVSEGMEELSSSMEEINASTEEVSSIVDDINSNIKQITTSIEASGKVALDMADKAQNLRDDTQKESKEILASYNDVKDDMQNSIKRSEVISKIQILVDSIKGITEQTNLLALNASIEAARAGELGKGFGVVAREIGILAQQSGDAVQEIEDVIREVLVATEEMKKNAEYSLEFMEKQIHSNLRTIENTAATYIQDSKQVYEILESLEQNAELLKNYSQSITVAVSGVADAISENTNGIVNIVNRTADIQEKTLVMEEVINGNRQISDEFSNLTDEFTI